MCLSYHQPSALLTGRTWDKSCLHQCLPPFPDHVLRCSYRNIPPSRLLLSFPYLCLCLRVGFLYFWEQIRQKNKVCRDRGVLSFLIAPWESPRARVQASEACRSWGPWKKKLPVLSPPSQGPDSVFFFFHSTEKKLHKEKKNQTVFHF